MIQKTLLLVITAITIAGCRKAASETVVLNFEKDLIPEGIALDAKSGKFFLSSLRKNKIVKTS